MKEIFHKEGGIPPWCSWGVRLDGNSYRQTRSPFPRAIRLSSSVFLAPTWPSPTSAQAIAPSEPSFWTHSLQIHCTRFVGPRSPSVAGPGQKTGTLQLAPSVGRVACAMISATVCKGRIKSPMGGYGGQSTVPYGENC